MDNPETVKIVFKNMPLIQIHKFAEPAARAALAAGKQGKFWEFHDELFAAKKLNNNVIAAISDKLGLDKKKFIADMNSKAIHDHIRQDLIDARNSGVTGTPTIFVNGRRLKERNIEALQDAVDHEMKKRLPASTGVYDN